MKFSLSGSLPVLSVAVLATASVKTVASAAEKHYRPSVRIAVNVTGKSGLDSAIKSYLTREFRRLDDVIITDTDPLYRISCVAMKNQTQGGYVSGYTLSFVVTSTMQATLTTNLISSRLSPEEAALIGRWNSNQGVMVDHILQVCPPEAVQKICGELVAQFDGSLIEEARQFAQRFIEATTPGPEDPSAPATSPIAGITVTEVTSDTRAEKKSGADAKPLTPTETFAVFGLKPGDTLNVRSGPGMSYSSVQSLPIGYGGIEVIGKSVMNDKTEWAQITFADMKGWVRKKYLRPE